MHTLRLSLAEAPTHLDLPGRGAPAEGRWADAVAALPDDSTLVRITGGEPLRLPDLPALLDALGDRPVVLHTDLPDLDDDDRVRPFARWDVRFRVRVPSVEADRLTALGGDVERQQAGLRNLQAFAYPFELEVPLWADHVAHLPHTLAHLLRAYSPQRLHVAVATGPAAPRWADIDGALRAFDATAPRPSPRLHVTGLPALALSLDSYTEVDLIVGGSAEDRWALPTDHPHDEPRPDEDALARRRVWLATPHDRRPGFRGDPLDRFEHATSVVLVRPGHRVFAVIERRRDGVPYLAAGMRFGLLVAGRFEEEELAARFRELAIRLHRAAGGDEPDLPALREIAHDLRRGMRPA